MKDFFKTLKFKIFAGIVALLIIGMGISALTYNSSSSPTSFLNALLSPFQQLFSNISDWADGVASRAESSSKKDEEIAELEKRIEALQSQIIDYEDIKKRNSLYEDVLEVKEENPDFKVEFAEVIARDSADLFYSFVINKGSSSGIEVNDPVISGKYLVGVVTAVTKRTATVLSILDPKVNASAYEVRSGEAGFVTGSVKLAADGLCRLSNLDRSTTIASGGIVATYGVGGVYPKGLIIGTVKSVEEDENSISMYCVLQPGVDIQTIKNVFIITYFDGQGES